MVNLNLSKKDYPHKIDSEPNKLEIIGFLSIYFDLIKVLLIKNRLFYQTHFKLPLSLPILQLPIRY